MYDFRSIFGLQSPLFWRTNSFLNFRLENSVSSLDIAVLHLFSSSGAQITVIKVQLAEGELSATVLMVCVGNDIWWSEEGGISQVILYYHHTSDTLSLLTIVLLAWGHTLTAGSDYTSVEVNL